jgi:hypothetical protein
MDIEYRMILDNLARASAQPDSLPWHVRIQDGTVQVGDEGGFGQAGGFTGLGGNFGVEQFGPSASRSVTLQWGTDAVMDPVQLTDLHNLYRRALQLPPLPDPPFITAARVRQQAKGHDRDGGGKKSGDGGAKGGSIIGLAAGEGDKSGGPVVASPDRPGLEFEVPVGWFCVGGKKDVPRDACYIGRYRDRYVWVTPEGLLGLNRFTLAVLSVVKLDPDQWASGRGGLAVTR